MPSLGIFILIVRSTLRRNHTKKKSEKKMTTGRGNSKNMVCMRNTKEASVSGPQRGRGRYGKREKS